MRSKNDNSEVEKNHGHGGISTQAVFHRNAIRDIEISIPEHQKKFFQPVARGEAVLIKALKGAHQKLLRCKDLYVADCISIKIGARINLYR